MHKLWGPLLDGQHGVESLEVADEGVGLEYPRQEGSASHEGSTAGHAHMDVELYQVHVILVNDECAVGGGAKLIKPG